MWDWTVIWDFIIRFAPDVNRLRAIWSRREDVLLKRFVLTLINLKIIKPEDFDVQVSGAVFLNDDGRKKVLSKWQEKKTYRYDTSVFEGKKFLWDFFAVCAKYVACKICAW